MQSGITVSPELHSAFNTFTSASSSQTQLALPVTITGESLTPQSPIPWPSGSSTSSTSNEFISALPTLSSQLQPKTPIYLLLRKSKSSGTSPAQLVAITYVPSNAPVRSKTLFAATRTTLVRELGLEKFSDTIFVTDPEEVLDPAQWTEREGGKSGQGQNGLDQQTSLLSVEERELQQVKRAEEEERHGTAGRDLMGEGGSGISGSGTSTPKYGGLKMKVTDEAKTALAQLANGNGESRDENDGSLVQLGIDMSSETIVLLASDHDTAIKRLTSKIPADRPTYNFFHLPSTQNTIFIYVCPGISKVKERMVYASSRLAVVNLAQSEGVTVAKKLETGDPDEISEDRLIDELGLKKSGDEISNSRQGFARPKRPGRR